MGFSRQEYWSGLPFPLPVDLSNPRIKPMSPALAGGFFIAEPGEPLVTYQHKCIILLFWRSAVKSGFYGLKSRCWQSCGPPRGSRGEFISSSWPRDPSSPKCIPPNSASSTTSTFPLPLTRILGLRDGLHIS